MDPCAYLSQGRFHRSIHCPRTNVRVTFALVGAWPESENVLGSRRQQRGNEAYGDDVVLFVLPSGASRYTGVALDGIAATKGVRMIAIDRADSGGTPTCANTERIAIATLQTLSVLEHMGVTKPSLLCHSAGWLYVLDLLTKAPPEMFSPLRIVATSPFVPTHASGSALGLLPKAVLEMAPTAINMLGSASKAFAWSSGLVAPPRQSESSTTEEDRAKTKARNDAKRQRNKRNKPNATFHPPFTPLTTYGLDAWKATKGLATPRHPRTGRPLTDGASLLFDYFVIENCMHAVVQDFKLCLGKVSGVDSVALDAWIGARLEHLAKTFNGSVVLLWAENDALIPSKGRTYLNATLRRALAKHQDHVTMQEWTIADGGHDTALLTAEVIDKVLDYLCSAARPLEGM